jgi:hypothetical protein
MAFNEADVKFYVLNSYSGLTSRVYCEVAAVVGETEKTYSAYARAFNGWSKDARRISKFSAGGRFATLAQAVQALSDVRDIADSFSRKRSQLAADENAAIQKLLGGAP